MKFEEFKENVENWARVRGIYDQSTEAHQQAKALEEIGEYLTAETDEERMDAIGDIAVCIINAAYIKGLDIKNFRTHAISYKQPPFAKTAYCIVQGEYNYALKYLSQLTVIHYLGGSNIFFHDCLEMAWNEIKDRKGMMVDGKYVKWENLNEEQRAEFNRRDAGNTLIRED